ncbi:MAG: cysteine desulfurase family protein [Bacteroidota bacterium]|nr:cysteine desulfurase family protein [Bacteroidota bacterium]MDP4258073.1 cysteine desulfurase family protein [Bacteroidota bacterium]
MNNERIYLDNAATTRLDEEVLAAMMPILQERFGNPSSLHGYGMEAKASVEMARKSIAEILGIKTGTLVFTSGGTESNNMAIRAALRDLGCSHVLYSPIEHHAVLHAIEAYSGGVGGAGRQGSSVVNLGQEGEIDLSNLERQLGEQRAEGRKCLVCLMHANNETGMITDLVAAGAICRKYDGLLFSDMVASIGHLPVNLSALPVDLASAAAHKFHGPKGVGLLYAREGLSLSPLLHGGGQERNRRAGTENVAGIVGMARALEVFMRDYERDSPQIRALKLRLVQGLQRAFPDIHFNGDPINGLYTIVSISLQKTEATEWLLSELDQAGISVSGGSACSGGGSHVMEAIGMSGSVNIRFSLSKYNTINEIVRAVSVISERVTGQVFSCD